MPTHTNSWSNAAPADADDINQGAAEMRKFRLDVDERMDVDHDWPASTDGGYHTAVHMKEQAADPASVLNVGTIYTKDEAGVTMPYYMDSAGTVTKLVYSDEGYRLVTEGNGGFWGDVIWKDADEVIIKCKATSGLTPFHGCVLSNGKFLKGTSDVTVQLPAGGSADGITAPLNNEWYIIWGYEDAGGALAYCLTWMPRTTFSTNNPTNTLALNQVNTQDIGLLFNPGANLLVWNASAKFETWRYNTAGGSTPTGACYVNSRVAATLTLDGALAVNNFSANDYVIQLDNFKPLAVDDGLVVDIIGARGYKDTGYRIRTDGAGAVIPFSMQDGMFLYSNGSGAADYGSAQGLEVITTTNVYVNYLLTYIPPDKTPSANHYSNADNPVMRFYYDTYGHELGGFLHQGSSYLDGHMCCVHSIVSLKDGGGTQTDFVIRGYVL